MVNINNLATFLLDNSSFIKSEEVIKVVESLKKVFIEKGFDLNSLKIAGVGETSINFEKDDLVIRLTFVTYKEKPTLTEYLSKSDVILKPENEKVVKLNYIDGKILELKKLSLDGITEADVLAVYTKLRDDGYLWYDIKKENLGKDANDNVYLMDYGELRYINDMPKFLKDRELQCHAIRQPIYNKIYLKNKKENLFKLKNWLLSLKDKSSKEENGNKLK